MSERTEVLKEAAAIICIYCELGFKARPPLQGGKYHTHAPNIGSMIRCEASRIWERIEIERISAAVPPLRVCVVGAAPTKEVMEAFGEMGVREPAFFGEEPVTPPPPVPELVRCEKCCCKDRCDEPGHLYRPNCPNCKGGGWVRKQ